MCMNIQDDLACIKGLGLLDLILRDKTTKRYILWGTDAHKEIGPDFLREKEIRPELITGEHAGLIATRASKDSETQSARTRQHAEVFTPMWVVKMMNDYADETWFGTKGTFDSADTVKFPKRKTWKHYVDSRRLEITCGEAPYIVSRYDAATGNPVDIKDRIGFLDRKLRVVNENAAGEAEWKKWALRAIQASYGYEFQGDNVLVARINLLMAYKEYMLDRWGHEPDIKDYRAVLRVVTWNIWQMDGLTGRVPYCRADDEYQQMTMDELIRMSESGKTLEEVRHEAKINTQQPCRIYDWRSNRSMEFLDLKKEEKRV